MSEVDDRRGDLVLVRLAQFDALGCDVVVTTRAGGVSRPPYDSLNLGDHVGDDEAHVKENRRRLADALGVTAGGLAVARQVHGTDVAVVGLGDVPGTADVLATSDARVAVCVLVADCAPIVIVDPAARVVVVAHAGWRGVASQVVTRAVDAAVRLGATAAGCHAAVGPCISRAGYQVGPEVAEAFRAAGCGHAVEPDGTGRFRADLAAACTAQLVGAGVPPTRVSASAASTDTDARYFSDRAVRPCGRFGLAARLREAAS